MSIRELHDTPGKWRRETKRLNINKDATERHGVSADENGNVQPATLDFSIGEYRPPIRKRQRVSQAKRGLTAAAFFPLLEKARQERKPEQSADEESGMDAKDDPFSPKVLEQRGTESDDLHEQRKGARIDSIKEMVSCRKSSRFFLPTADTELQMDGRHPPPLSHRSGILSFMIHSVADIHLEKGAGPVKAAARRFKPGSQTKVMRKAELPSTYVRAFWNDLCIYRTRMTPVRLDKFSGRSFSSRDADRTFSPLLRSSQIVCAAFFTV